MHIELKSWRMTIICISFYVSNVTKLKLMIMYKITHYRYCFHKEWDNSYSVS